MMIIVLENAPDRLRGRLSVWMVEIRAGVYVASFGKRVRDYVWNTVVDHIGDGNAILAHTSANDAGYEFDTCGKNRRVPVDYDGLKLVQFGPEEAKPRQDSTRQIST